MSDSRRIAKRVITKPYVMIGIVLTLLVFAFFSFFLRPYVPIWQADAENQGYITFFAAFTAACMAGVFWLAWGMFSVVLRDMQLSEADRADNKR